MHHALLFMPYHYSISRIRVLLTLLHLTTILGDRYSCLILIQPALLRLHRLIQCIYCNIFLGKLLHPGQYELKYNSLETHSIHPELPYRFIRFTYLILAPIVLNPVVSTSQYNTDPDNVEITTALAFLPILLPYQPFLRFLLTHKT